jgi:hypothetical protein
MKRSIAVRLRKLSRRTLALLAGGLAGSLAAHGPGSAQAQTVWNGSVSNQYNNASNWTPNTVPNSSSTTAAITNATNNPVVISGVNPTLGGLTIGMGESLTLSDNQLLMIVAATSPGTTISNNGAITINSAGDNTDLVLSGANGIVTLGGSGTLTTSNFVQNRIYAAGSGVTLVNSSTYTILGAGQLGVGLLALNNQGTVNASLSAGLFVIPSAAGVTNTGTLEATSSGTLNLVGSVANTGGTILASGASAVVNLNGSTITGGTLNTASGGTMFGGNSTLSGVTISSGSTVTAQDNTTTTLAGTITNNGTIAMKSAGDNTDLVIGSGTVSNTGGGSITMSNFVQNRIFSTSGGTLVNDTNNTIQGAGQIGVGQNFNLSNKGTINANVSNSLAVSATQPVVNTGLLEATGGGTLDLQSAVTNTGGNITATGTNSVVNLFGSTITGGTLNTSSGGTMFIGNSALSGVTISSGSTVTASDNTSTVLLGTITNNGTIAERSGGDNTDIRLVGNITLAGGPGSLTMSNFVQNRIFGNTGNEQLTVGAGQTIQGAGQIGVGLMSLVNNGTVLANVSNNLRITPNAGGVTNNGVFQANAGSTLNVTTGFNNFNNTNGTLTGGTYNVFGTTGSPGTFQFNNGGFTNDVLTNAATILLDGAGSRIFDQGSSNALAKFASNTATGSFTIQDGRNFTSGAINFGNFGTVTIGSATVSGADTFTVGGTNDYVQSGGTTTLANASSILAVAAGHSVDLFGGTLQGFGTITGNLSNSGGTVMPGTPGVAGVLNVTGNYIDPPSSHLFIQIGGPDPLHGLSQLDVSGTVN